MKKRKRRFKRLQPSDEIMKRRKPRLKRLQLSDTHISCIAEAVATSFEMAEKGLRPAPRQTKNIFEEDTFTGELEEQVWEFADQLLCTSIASDQANIPIKFDILTNNYEFATALVDISIIAHLEFSVTPVDTLPSDDCRYSDIQNAGAIWRIHSPDFQEYPEETLTMLLLSSETDTNDGDQNDNEK